MEARRILLYCTLAFSITLEFYVRAFNQWHRLGNHMDTIMHFFWGLNIFLLLVVWLKWKPVSALYGVFAFQMGWELIEMVGDYLIIQSNNMIDIFWWDGIKDTIADLIGGFIGWTVLTFLPGGLGGLSEIPYARALRRLPWYMLPGVIIGAVLWFITGSSPQFFGIVWITVALVAAFWKR